MSIPISTTPGRSGFGPQLSLSYDSGSGNGPFGLGWSSSLPAITRKTDKGLPRYQDADESDTFILSGAEDLVPALILRDGEWIKDLSKSEDEKFEILRYRPRIEGLFARIERWTHRDTGEIHWRSISRDNTTTLYGKTAESRITEPSEHPAKNPRIYSWLICESYDDKGNAVSYRYEAENSNNIDASQANERNRSPQTRSANRYLKRILYGNRTPSQKGEDLSGRDDWMFEAVFDYDEGHYEVLPADADGRQFVRASKGKSRDWSVRLDSFSIYRAGFEVRTYRLCRRVLMFHHFPDKLGVDDYLVRSTEFIYNQNPIASTITQVLQSGYVLKGDGTYLRRSLPPIDLEYSNLPDIEKADGIEMKTIDKESLRNLPYGLDGANYQWADLDGEGISGILTEQAGAWFYKPNLGGGRFGGIQVVEAKPSLAALGSGHQQLMDLAGDGQLDLVELVTPAAGFFERTLDQHWNTFIPFTSSPNIAWNDPNLKFIDLTGDGHADVIIAEDQAFIYHPSLAEEGFGPSTRVFKPYDEESGPKLIFADGTQSIYLADMSGDGLTDLIRILNGEVSYWPNLGYGRFGAKVTMDKAPWYDSADLFNQQRIRLADIDGSGVTDIIYLGRDGIYVYFNQSGNSWSRSHKLPYYPQIDNLTSVTVIDLLGQGTACLVWSSSLPGDFGRQMRYIDLMSGIKPHLLVSVKNNMGAETKVHYVSSTKFYLEDRAAGRPWITRLPFPVHVVEKVEVYDRLSRNRFVRRYSYHHGYFDEVEREFRGFGRVDQLDTEEFAALSKSDAFPVGDNVDQASHVPPVLTKTWFHTGAYLQGRMISRQFEEEYYSEGDPSMGETGLSNEQLKAMLLDDTVLSEGLQADEKREACRSLKDSILRQEIYAIDRTEEEDRPYSVSERNYTIKRLQPQGINKYAVFFTHSRETIDFHYERKLYKVSGDVLADPISPPQGAKSAADPRVTHSMTLAVDDYGNVLKAMAIGYGRRFKDPSLTEEDQGRQMRTEVTLTLNSYTNAVIEDDAYRAPLPSEARTFEVINVETTPAQGGVNVLLKLDEMIELVEGTDFSSGRWDIPYEDVQHVEASEEHPSRRPIEQVRMLYRSNELDRLLPIGEVESLALSGETYKLAFTSGLLSLVYQRRHAGQDDESLLPDPSLVLGKRGPDGGGYLDLDGNGHWWIPSGQVFYSPDPDDEPPEELDYARNHFFLPHRYRDPFHTDAVSTEAFVSYDNYDLLAEEIRDALGNRVTVGERNPDGELNPDLPGNDYRVLQPRLVMDANRNRAAVAFDALGMVAGTAVMGKPEDSPQRGDLLDAAFNPDPTQAEIDQFLANPKGPVAATLLGKATTRIIYDLTGYFREPDPDKRQPAFAATIVRETHASDPLPPGGLKIQVSLSYSDGFGREIQKKIQAEKGPVPRRDPATGKIIVDSEGQPVMTADDISPRWVGSGWTVFNNKGKPVRQYEPFFTDTHRYEFEVKIGVSPVLFYDPVERVVATLNPDHTYEKVIFDPWQQYTWDVNDTVALDPRTDEDISGYVSEYFKQIAPDPASWKTWLQQRGVNPSNPPEETPSLNPEKKAAIRTLIHAGTPALAHLDSLGRTFLTVAHNRFKHSNAPPVEEFYSTRVNFDIEGNQREVVDAKIDPVTKKGRIVMRYDYDMLGNRIHQSSMEAGERWMIGDVAGNPIRAWDSRDHQFRTGYDPLRRPIETRLREASGNEKLIGQTVYGEGEPEPEVRNLRGMAFQLFDQAGVVTSEEYDFKGNLLRSNRKLARDYKNILDWSASVDIESETFSSSATYDALNRPVELVAPHSDQPEAKTNIIRHAYNEANLLEGIEANLQGSAVATIFVKDIDYNAKGQRTQIVYGSGASEDTQGVTTTYDYDTLTFRLTELITRRDSASFTDDCPQPHPEDWPGCQLQNLHYTYDPAGNITHIRDDAQQTIFFSQRRVEPSNDYTYDAIYRLIEARGREHLGQAGVPEPHSHNDHPRVGLEWSANDGNAMGTYLERYIYDEVGNILAMRHRGCDPSNPGWTRSYDYEEASQIEPEKKSNRLSRTTIKGTPKVCPYLHDVHGNMTRMPHLADHPDDAPNMHWDYSDQLRKVDLAGVGGTAFYVYDASGQRARKVVERSPGLTEERIYLGGFEVFRKHNGSGEVTLERETLHIMDEQQRIALVETRTIDTASDDPAPKELIRYQLDNHLKSVSLELDDEGQIISYEEYYPYGSTSYQAGRNLAEVNLKRYRYTGRERDEETGFNYHGARYYTPWLGRWISADPTGLQDALNLYGYTGGNPINFNDPAGMERVCPNSACHSPPEETRYKTIGYEKGPSSYAFQPGELKEHQQTILTNLAHGRFTEYETFLFKGWATPSHSYEGMEYPLTSFVPIVAQQYVGGTYSEPELVGWKTSHSLSGNYLTVIRDRNGNVLSERHAGEAAPESMLFGPFEYLGYAQLGRAVIRKTIGRLFAKNAAGEATITLYRGVNQSHFDFAAQSTGLVRPNRRWWQFWKTSSSGLEHNVKPGGTLSSPVTSWTTDPRVAENFALRPWKTPGVVITAKVPLSRAVSSPNLKEVVLPWNGEVVSEAEVFVRGVVQGVARWLKPYEK